MLITFVSKIGVGGPVRFRIENFPPGMFPLHVFIKKKSSTEAVEKGAEWKEERGRRPSWGGCNQDGDFCRCRRDP